MLSELPYLAAVISAVVIHEAAHILVMLMLGVKSGKKKIGLFGIGIAAEYAVGSYHKEIAVSAAGSAANLIFAVVFRELNELSAACLAYGVFNLLPVSMLDGGEILGNVLAMLGIDERARRKLGRLADLSFTLILWVISVYLALNGGGEGLLITVLYMIFAAFSDKGY